MATYHLAVTVIRRAAGRSSIAAAAYRRCCTLRDARTGEIHDYSRKRCHVASGITGWNESLEELWNSAEASEKRRNAVLAREITVALPHELTDVQRANLVNGYAEYLRNRHAVAVSWDLHRAHRESDSRNEHGHFMITTRRVDDCGVFGEKTRELDVKPQSGTHLKTWRREWETRVNDALLDAGLNKQVDSRSLQDREKAGEVPRLPLLKLGPASSAMERRGVRTDKGNRNRRTTRQNRKLAHWHLQATAFGRSANALCVERAIDRVRQVSEANPLPVWRRRPAYDEMFTTAIRAWGPSWPSNLTRAIHRTWPAGLRTVAFVTAQILSGGMVPYHNRDIANFVAIARTFISSPDDVRNRD